jgi:hypothetical protein
MAGTMHWWFKLNPPLIIQIVMQPLTLFDSPAFHVHIMGKSDDVEPYERPWASANFMSQASKTVAAWEESSKKREERGRRMMNGMKKGPKAGKAEAKAAKDGKKGK